MRLKLLLLTVTTLLIWLISSQVEAAVTFRSKVEFIPATTGTSPTVSEPASCANGDTEVAAYLTTATGAPTFPAGWTSTYNGSSTNTAWRIGYIIRSGAPNLGFTHTGNIYYELHIACLQGASTTSFDAQSTTGSVTTSTTALPNPTAVSPVQSTSLAIAGGFNFGFGASQTWIAGAGYTIITKNTGAIDFVMSTKSLASNASEDPAIYTSASGPGSADNMWNGFVMTFTDAGGGGGATPCTKMLLLGAGC